MAVKKIGIEQAEGQYTVDDIGVNADNVDITEELNLTTKLDSIDRDIAKRPVNHSSTGTGFGLASDTKYGHTKVLSNYYDTDATADENGKALSMYGAQQMFQELSEGGGGGGGFPAGCDDAFTHNNIYRGIELVNKFPIEGFPDAPYNENAPYESVGNLNHSVFQRAPFTQELTVNFSNIYIGDTITIPLYEETEEENSNPEIPFPSIPNPIEETPSQEENEFTVIGYRTWVVMGINTYLNQSYYIYDNDFNEWIEETINTPHLVLVPKQIIDYKKMCDDIASFDLGYDESDIYTMISPGLGGLTYSPVWDVLINDFTSEFDGERGKCYIRLFPEYICGSKYDGQQPPAVDEYGVVDGKSVRRNSHYSFASLLNEVEVFGDSKLSSSEFDFGANNIQLPGFRLNPSLINKSKDGYWKWWLSGVAEQDKYVIVDGTMVSKEDADTGAFIDDEPDPENPDQVIGIVPKVLFTPAVDLHNMG